MPSNRRSKDWVLGGRHLVGVFVLLVVLFGMVFTLGYLLGRNQYDAQLRAAASTIPGKPDSVSDKPVKSVKSLRGPGGPDDVEKPAAPPSDWDFYHSAEPAKPAAPLAEPKSLVPSRTDVPGAGRSAPRIDSARSNIKSVSAPIIPHGATVLQVAAMARQSDAVSLAQALQHKRFPAFVLPPGADRYYRVQVGPYTEPQSADLARQRLESQGFKAITRR
jgi:cell division septation protein DedD